MGILRTVAWHRRVSSGGGNSGWHLCHSPFPRCDPEAPFSAATWTSLLQSGRSSDLAGDGDALGAARHCCLPPPGDRRGSVPVKGSWASVSDRGHQQYHG
jgi:hypothetical protein